MQGHCQKSQTYRTGYWMQTFNVLVNKSCAMVKVNWGNNIVYSAWEKEKQTLII